MCDNSELVIENCYKRSVKFSRMRNFFALLIFLKIMNGIAYHVVIDYLRGILFINHIKAMPTSIFTLEKTSSGQQKDI